LLKGIFTLMNTIPDEIKDSWYEPIDQNGEEEKLEDDCIKF